jgi:hypothetical protein
MFAVFIRTRDGLQLDATEETLQEAQYLADLNKGVEGIDCVIVTPLCYIVDNNGMWQPPPLYRRPLAGESELE